MAFQDGNLRSLFFVLILCVFQGAVGTNVTIDVLCKIMSNKNIDELSRYAQVNSLMLDTYGENCLDVNYANMIEDLKRTSWSSSAAEGGESHEHPITVLFFRYDIGDTFYIKPCGSV